MVSFTLAISSAILSILIGIIILIWPKSLNYAVAIYLLLTGILQLFNQYM